MKKSKNKKNYLTIKTFVHWAHQALFLTGIGERTTVFLKGLSWSFSAAIFSRLLSGLTTLFLARKIGPQEFGIANLILAATQWIQIPLFLGIPTALIHFLGKTSQTEKKNWIKDGFLLMFFLFGLTIIMGYFSRRMTSKTLSLSLNQYYLALFYCICIWPFNLLKTYLNAEEKFKIRSWIEIIYALFFPFLAIFFINTNYSSSIYILSLSIPYFILGTVGLSKVNPLRLNSFVSPDRIEKLFLFGALASMGSIAAAMFETPSRLAINRTLGSADVGILSAYQGASTQVASFFSAAVIQVFYPIASRSPNKQSLLKKINKLAIIFFPISLLLFLVIIRFFFVILGHKYPFSIFLAFSFSIASSLLLIHSLLAWLVISYGTRGVIVNGLVGIGTGALNFLGCLWVAPRLQILGTSIVFIIANLIAIFIFSLSSTHKWLEKEQG